MARARTRATTSPYGPRTGCCAISRSIACPAAGRCSGCTTERVRLPLMHRARREHFLDDVAPAPLDPVRPCAGFRREDVGEAPVLESERDEIVEGDARRHAVRDRSVIDTPSLRVRVVVRAAAPGEEGEAVPERRDGTERRADAGLEPAAETGAATGEQHAGIPRLAQHAVDAMQ